MEEIRRDGEQVVVSASMHELRALGATLLEALDGGYAFPDDIWEELVGYPPGQVRDLMGDLTRARQPDA